MAIDTHLCTVIIYYLVASATCESLPAIEENVLRGAWIRAKRSLELETENTDIAFAGHPGSRIPRDETLHVWRKAEIFNRAVDHVCETQNVTRSISEHLIKRDAPRDDFDSNILCRQRTISCNPRFKYRRIDGACNNIQHPEWGMAVSKLERLLNPIYGDGISSVRRSVEGGPLPLPREISTTAITDISAPDHEATHMVMFFGQFLDHDITFTPDRRGLKCCGNQANIADCLPINIPPSDRLQRQFRVSCMEFGRSLRACGNGVREQMNQNTAFVDGSQIYGSTTTEMNSLRTFTEGLLKFSTGPTGELLPQNANDSFCVKHEGSNLNCFVAGDNRVNENPGLLSLHVLFLREHNRIARELTSLSFRDDEAIYQQARRIVIAELQNIVYSDFLTTILSRSTIDEFSLSLPEAEIFTEYNPNVVPNVINSFSTAAYRFGHSLIQGIFNMKGHRALDLSEHYNNPGSVHVAGIEPLLLGAVLQPSQRADNFLTGAVTRQLFRRDGSHFGLDLASLNIQRGRDHGLPPYNAFRRLIRLAPATSEVDLHNLFTDADSVQHFMNVYKGRLEDIDLWPAGIAEKPKDEGMVGPTFSAILGLQFNRLKWGDRFFFTHRNQAGSFTHTQLLQLRNRTLGSIICDNANVDRIQQSVFRIVGAQNLVIDCRNHPKLDLRIF